MMLLPKRSDFTHNYGAVCIARIKYSLLHDLVQRPPDIAQ